MDLAEKILNRLSISKPQRKFLLTLFTAILIVRGKANFRNLCRYSEISEKTYWRQYGKPFDFVTFNREVINQALDTARERIIAFDPSFVPKSGKKTYGLDHFWNGCHSRAEKGLEVSTVAIVDVERGAGFALSVRQTVAPSKPDKALVPSPPKTAQRKARKARKARKPKKTEADEETLIDVYLQHLQDVRPSLQPEERHVVVDGAFAKKKYVDGVVALDLHVIGKLRCDANMRFLYTGPKRSFGSGRQKTYDGKVNWMDLSRFEYVGEEDGILVYTQLLNHLSLKRTVRVVVLLDLRKKDQVRYALLFTTDLQLDAKTVLRYYKARFQIEFIFRDAKQFTGLCDCQSRDARRLDFHFNASLATLNLTKLDHLQTCINTEPTAFSMASVKACFFNDFYLSKIFSMFDLDQSLMEKSPEYQLLRDLGKMRA